MIKRHGIFQKTKSERAFAKNIEIQYNITSAELYLHMPIEIMYGGGVVYIDIIDHDCTPAT